MKERMRFVKDYGRGLFRMSELCAHYGVSRKTGCKWLARFAEAGAAGLAHPLYVPAVRRGFGVVRRSSDRAPQSV